MEYKIFEANGIENENVDGAAINNLAAANQSGIVANVLNECQIIPSSNVLTLDTGLLIISGIRVKLLAPIDFTLIGIPATIVNYHLVAKIVLDKDRAVDFSIQIRPEESLKQENLFKTESGTYELEIAKFVHFTDGSIKNLHITCPILKGTSSGNDTLDYNGLTNKPIICIDLTLEDFVPTANTYYQHTGETNETFTNGVIYYYDGTEYKAIDGSGTGDGVDVQINGTSITENGVANISTSEVVKEGITNNKETLTEAEQDSAQEWLGVTDKFAPKISNRQGALLAWVNNGVVGFWADLQSNAASAAPNKYAMYLPLNEGGDNTVTGYLLTAIPEKDYQAANKKYVENAVKRYKHVFNVTWDNLNPSEPLTVDFSVSITSSVETKLVDDTLEQSAYYQAFVDILSAKYGSVFVIPDASGFISSPISAPIINFSINSAGVLYALCVENNNIRTEELPSLTDGMIIMSETVIEE